MKKKLIFILTLFVSIINLIDATECYKQHQYKSNMTQSKLQMNTMIKERLDLSENQKNVLEKERIEFRQKMSVLISQMQNKRDEINSIYNSGIPKFQADIKTASLKSELVKLRQEAQKLRQEHRKSFESNLDATQKIEFEKIKQEVYSTYQNKNF